MIFQYIKNLNANLRQIFALKKQKQAKVDKVRDIFGYLLPPFVRDYTIQGIQYISQNQDIVSIVFCDIHLFEEICKKYDSEDLSELLDEIFNKFDKFCKFTGTTKIETVGKTYLACAGLTEAEQDLPYETRKIHHSDRAVELALQMLKAAQNFQLKTGRQMQLKIGINTGPISSGVVGYHKPQFVLVGDTINTASRMCSTIEQPDCIQISESTYTCLQLKSHLKFVQSQVYAKGKGEMATYLITDNFRKLTGSTFMDTPKHQKELGLSFTQQFEIANQQYRSNIYITNLFKSSFTKVGVEQEKQFFKFFDYIGQEPLRQLYMQEQSGIQTSGIVSLICLLSLQEVIFCFEALDWKLIIFTTVYFISIVNLLLVKAFHSKIRAKIWYSLFLTIQQFIVIIIIELFYFSHNDYPVDLIAFQIIAYSITLSFSGIFIQQVVCANCIACVIWFVLAIIGNDIDAILYGFAIVAYIIILSIVVYFHQKQYIEFIKYKGKTNNEIQRTEELLENMLPKHVYINIQNDERIIDNLSNVTMLYADIVGFTAFSSQHQPQTVISMLSTMFEKFDKLCIYHNLYKVHTIGDCYVAMGFVSNLNRDTARECLNVLLFAQDLIAAIDEVNQIHGTQLGMRIGMHTGDIMAGITGTNIVRYDVYGKNVTIANKMESEGESGRVLVSKNTKELLMKAGVEGERFEFYKKVEISKFKSSIESYFIV